MPLSAREQQVAQAERDAELLPLMLDAMERGVWMPWATTDQDGDVVLFATEALADRYVDTHHGGDQTFKASQCPIRTEPEPDDDWCARCGAAGHTDDDPHT